MFFGKVDDVPIEAVIKTPRGKVVCCSEKFPFVCDFSAYIVVKRLLRAAGKHLHTNHQLGIFGK